MPEYAYKCKDCGHELTVVKGMSERGRPEACPVCGGETRRKWTAPSVGNASSAPPLTGG